MPVSSVAAGSYASTQRLLSLTKPQPDAAESDFSTLLKDSMKSASNQAATADQEVGRAVSGGTDLINVVTAVAESETAIQTLVAVRDKVIAAYDTVMQMTI